MSLRDAILCASLIGLACCGCAPRDRIEDVAAPRESAQRLPLGIWRDTSIEAARAIANGDYALARRLNIALARDIYAAQQRSAPPTDPASSRAGSAPSEDPEPSRHGARNWNVPAAGVAAPIDTTKPTLDRAADALAELANKIGGDK